MTDRRYKGPVKTQLEIIVTTLWQEGRWLATWELQNVETPYGFIGNAGHTRVRELARNDCPEKLKDKVEKARGGAIGLDPRYEYFRYKLRPTREDHLRIARQAVAEFEATVTGPRGTAGHERGRCVRASS